MISAPFGGGMGRLREICGTFSGINMALGLAKGKESKAELYTDVQNLAKRFTEDNGSIICRELLGLSVMGRDNPIPSPRTGQYYKKRPCSELCRYAADLLDEYLSAKK